MKIEFQYLAKGAEKPDNSTFSDVGYDIDSGEPVPAIGDCIMIPVCSPTEQRGNYKHCKILARHFQYSSVDNKQQKHVIAIVTDADDVPENNFRE